jgi:FMN phosphatase YigB (HAD superfamily)
VIKAAIFDLGSTLIAFQGEWPGILQDSARALIESLQSSGVVFDRETFAAAFRQENERYQRQRQIDHVERTTAFVLREVFEAQGIPEPPAEVVRRSLQQMYAVSEARWRRVPEAE